MNDVAIDWANRFGLALTPLFAADEIDTPEAHHVLLDGGYGSFALTADPDAHAYADRFSSWAWSSNLAHHVAVTRKEIIVTRWDKPEPEVLTRNSVDKRLEAFYDYLVADRVRSNQKVVSHLLDLFRRIRSLVAETRQPDDLSVAAFLGFIEKISEDNPDNNLVLNDGALAGGKEVLGRRLVTFEP